MMSVLPSLLLSIFILAISIHQASCSSSSSDTGKHDPSVRSWLGKLGGGSLQPPKHIKRQPIDESFSEDDELCMATFIAETNLPTDLGMFRLRAYRTPQGPNQFVGREPCVIYSANKAPFGKDGSLLENVPVRVHDQCFTSEVFRSQRYVALAGCDYLLAAWTRD